MTDAEFATLLARAQTIHPTLVAPDAFRERAAQLWPGPFLAEDVYLATAMLAGDAQAVGVLRAMLRSAIRQHARGRMGDSDCEELEAELSEQMLVGPSAGLRNFRATGPLAAWVGVAAARKVVAFLKRSARGTEFSDAMLWSDLGQAGAELSQFRDGLNLQLSACFAAAIRGLERKQRLLLRQHHLDGVGLQGLAAIYDVHRATIVRWLAGARASLLENLRNEIAQKLQVQRLDVDSLVRAVDRRFEVSASLFLSQSGPS
jgi:RNA polymerase sigma-70 factor (ECF subfamily)